MLLLGLLFQVLIRAILSCSDDSYSDYKYFRGGFTSQTYGSRYNLDSEFDAVQFEAPGEMRWEGGKSVRDGYAVGLGNAVAAFFAEHY